MDYHVLRWKFEGSSTAVRQFFIKNYRSADQNFQRPDDRTLLVVNIPSYCDENSLSRFFGRFGKVDFVQFQKNISTAPVVPSTSDFFRIIEQESIKGHKIAFVVFKTTKSVEKALNFSDSVTEPLVLSTEDSPVETGMSAWLRERRRPLPSLVDLKREIDSYMEEYDTKVEEEKRKAKAKEGVPDEEGWTTVTRVGKKRGIRQEDVNTEEAGPAAKKKNSEKELADFYRFQMHDGKTKQMSELRRKFEEDKEKQAAMKSARKFKPF